MSIARNGRFKTFAYTTFALIAFAANSVLCRLALGDETIDAAGFTAVRLLSSSVTLWLILLLLNTSNKKQPSSTPSAKGSWFSALMLFGYAVCFSYAYISLDTATGALVLFGVVQMTMISLSLLSGQKLALGEWCGLLLAFAGFVYLVLPDVTTPSFFGLVLMTLAGIAWGVYTLRGKTSTNPLGDTAFNFFRTTPMVLLLILLALASISLTTTGVILAILSGAIASGIGYSVWYSALNDLSSTEAAVVQLSVPIIAAVGGVIFVNEALTFRLTLAGSIILSGILLVVMTRRRQQAKAVSDS